jgi:hypothetical protein
VLGVVGFYDWYWNDRFSSAVGYSYVHIDNSNRQAANAFRNGHYALGNVISYPFRTRLLGRAPVGTARELPRRILGRRLQDPVLGEVQLQLPPRRKVMTSARRRGSPRPVCAAAVLAAGSLSAQTPERIEGAMKAAYEQYQGPQRGQERRLHPGAGQGRPNIYGIALVTADGKVYTAGDVKSEVSIQSISKVFTMAKVIEEQGADSIEKTDRRRRDGHAVQLHRGRRVRAEGARRPGDQPAGQPGRDHRDQHGAGREPGRGLEEPPRVLLGLRRTAAGVNQEVFKSESDTNQRNQAIGYLMYAYGFIKDGPHAGDDVYTSSAR